MESLNSNQLPSTAIEKDVAINRAKLWRDYLNANENITNIRAFNISKSDLVSLLNEDGVKSVRAYLGINENNQIDLLFVGVDKPIGENGQDMIDYNNQKYVYDLTTPCPAMCDPSSPLNSDQ